MDSAGSCSRNRWVDSPRSSEERFEVGERVSVKNLPWCERGKRQFWNNEPKEKRDEGVSDGKHDVTCPVASLFKCLKLKRVAHLCNAKASQQIQTHQLRSGQRPQQPARAQEAVLLNRLNPLPKSVIDSSRAQWPCEKFANIRKVQIYCSGNSRSLVWSAPLLSIASSPDHKVGSRDFDGHDNRFEWRLRCRQSPMAEFCPVGTAGSDRSLLGSFIRGRVRFSSPFHPSH